jgi:hypothetical protein
MAVWYAAYGPAGLPKEIVALLNAEIGHTLFLPEVKNRMAEILSGEDMLSADAFANLLGTTRMTVNAKRQKRQLLGLEGAKRGFRFPQWQVGKDGKPFGTLPELFNRIGDDGWAVYRFLVQRHRSWMG